MHNDGAQIVQPLNFGSEVRRCAQVEVDSIFCRLRLGTALNQMLGPPQPGASTKARSAVESSSTFDPRAAAQNSASRKASAQSKVSVLMKLAMELTLKLCLALGQPGSRHSQRGPGSRLPGKERWRS